MNMSPKPIAVTSSKEGLESGKMQLSQHLTCFEHTIVLWIITGNRCTQWLTCKRPQADASATSFHLQYGLGVCPSAVGDCMDWFLCQPASLGRPSSKTTLHAHQTFTQKVWQLLDVTRMNMYELHVLCYQVLTTKRHTQNIKINIKIQLYQLSQEPWDSLLLSHIKIYWLQINKERHVSGMSV